MLIRHGRDNIRTGGLIAFRQEDSLVVHRLLRIVYLRGEKMVLLTLACDALFVWRKFVSMDEQDGVNCAVFRNESGALSSDLIREAVGLAWARWPGERLYTYVNPAKVKSTNPGYCFQMAGWRKCGLTKGGLVVLELLPPAADEMELAA